jgi:hypothetical protein
LLLLLLLLLWWWWFVAVAHHQATVQSIAGDAAGRVASVTLSTGETLPAQVVIAGIGAAVVSALPVATRHRALMM